MDELYGTTVVGTAWISGTVLDSDVSLVQGKVGKALFLNDSVEGAVFQPVINRQRESTECTEWTLSTWILMNHQVYFSGHARFYIKLQDPRCGSVDIISKHNKLESRIFPHNYGKITFLAAFQYDLWYYYTLTWHNYIGAHLFINGNLTAHMLPIIQGKIKIVEENKVYFGRPESSKRHKYRSGKCLIDEFHFSSQWQDSDSVQRLFNSYN